MGNEFGHPEWIDFPRPGNGFSWERCQRKWSLRDNPDLRFGDLATFDEVICYWESVFTTMNKGHQYITLADDDTKIIIYERGELIYLYNFHPTNSYADFMVGSLWDSDLMILYETDEARFGGHQRLDVAHNKWFKVKPV